MKKNLWKRVVAIGISFEVFVSSMSASVYADEIVVGDDSYIVADDETEAVMMLETDGAYEDILDDSIISESNESEVEDEFLLGIPSDETEEEEILQAAEASSGKCGPNLSWVLDASGALTISGTGDMYDYSSYTSPFEGRDDIIRIIINYGMTNIDSYSLGGLDNLKSIELPDSLRSIGNCAFYGCVSLTNIVIPDGVSCIDCGTFQNCSSLTSITIPASVKSIAEGAFEGCDSLSEVNYTGTMTQWLQITIGDDNQALYDAHVRGEPEHTVPESEVASSEKDTIFAEEENIRISSVIGTQSFSDFLNTVSSTEYNPKLSYLLAGMAWSAYNNQNCAKSLRNLGFSDPEVKPDRYEEGNLIPAHFIAKKTLDDGTILVMVTIRGSASIWNWITNLTFSTSEVLDGSHKHLGFNMASRAVYENLESFLGGIPKENVKYVITGHSLGGATANLLSIMLSDEGVPNSNVYNYNFGCPDVARCNSIDWNPFGKHDNIFNIANAQDLVSIVPGVVPTMNDTLFQWGKFGRSYWFSYNWSDPEYTFIDWSLNGHYKAYSYLDYLKNLSNISDFKSWLDVHGSRINIIADQVKKKIHSLFCPVDAEVYDKNGNLVASVINNKPNYYGSVFGEIMIFVHGDEKVICLPADRAYDIRLMGTDTGEMTYNVSDVDINTQEIRDQKTYESIALTDNKEMSTQSEGMIGDTKLYVLDEKGSTIAEINEDGSESKHVHTWDSGKVTKAATTSATGIKTFSCTDCGETKTESIAKLKPQKPTASSEKTTISKTPSIKKPAAAKGKITVKWKHFKHTSKKTKKIWKKIKKVQVQCATDSAFKNIVKTMTVKKSKTSAKIKGLKKKTTYYVRVRYYDGTGYSAWSKVKKVKTK